MDDNLMLPEERNAAKTILEQMGLHDSDKYQEEIDYDLSNEYDTFQEVYDDRDIIAKPKSAIQKENAKESARKGEDINDTGLKPVKDTLIMKMNDDREKVTKSGIVLSDLRTVKADSPIGTIVALNDNSEYEFKVGDRIIVDLRHVRHRYNSQGDIHLIIHKDGVLGVYE